MFDNIAVKKAAESLKVLYGRIVYSKNIDGITPPSVLVGEYKYPKVTLGVLASKEDNIIDNPILYDEKTVRIEDIIRFRLSMINLRKYAYVNDARKQDKTFENIIQSEISVKPVDIEAELKKTKILQPKPYKTPQYGIYGLLNKLILNSNPKIPRIVDKIIDENKYLKAKESIIMLYNNYYSDYYIARLLSLGILGLHHNRKFVPSKWSLTATHKIISEYLRSKIKEFRTIDGYTLFYKKYYGNIFYVLLKPGIGNIELLEAILPGSVYNLRGDKPILGRDDTSGGYYATELSALEYMNSIKRKGDIVVVRIVTKEYYTPLGVWVLREGIKRAFMNPVGRFTTLKEALLSLNNRIRRYIVNPNKILKYSRILKQNSIYNYLNIAK